MLFLFRYYKEDKDVQEDKELQAYLNELSLNGTGENGGIGRVNMNTLILFFTPKFPPKIHFFRPKMSCYGCYLAK